MIFSSKLLSTLPSIIFERSEIPVLTSTVWPQLQLNPRTIGYPFGLIEACSGNGFSNFGNYMGTRPSGNVTVGKAIKKAIEKPLTPLASVWKSSQVRQQLRNFSTHRTSQDNPVAFRSGLSQIVSSDLSFQIGTFNITSL
ncbi:MAG: hypothetical protein OXF46_00440 [Rhodobacteraceae bacterium]|nr:hypothetical protein [Paracoccaceae bacterium]